MDRPGMLERPLVQDPVERRRAGLARWAGRVRARVEQASREKPGLALALALAAGLAVGRALRLARPASNRRRRARERPWWRTRRA